MFIWTFSHSCPDVQDKLHQKYQDNLLKNIRVISPIKGTNEVTIESGAIQDKRQG